MLFYVSRGFLWSTVIVGLIGRLCCVSYKTHDILYGNTENISRRDDGLRWRLKWYLIKTEKHLNAHLPKHSADNIGYEFASIFLLIEKY